jgi:hypothetical protein
MNWYRENRWLGNFLVAFGGSLLFALWFLFHTRSELSEALAQHNQLATERTRLEHLDPFPNEENFRETQVRLERYGAVLNELKAELKEQVIPLAPLAPNEFQSRLSRAILLVTERARTNRVKLPDHFYFGFDEFATTLPNATIASVLSRELAQIELLINALIDAHVDAITGLKRPISLAERSASPAGQKSAAYAPPVVERAVVELTFTASPSAMRKVLNQIANSDRQFFIVRALHIRNEQQDGPPRETATAGKPAAADSAGAIKFIVGNEHVETAAAVELVRFTF